MHIKPKHRYILMVMVLISLPSTAWYHPASAMTIGEQETGLSRNTILERLYCHMFRCNPPLAVEDRLSGSGLASFSAGNAISQSQYDYLIKRIETERRNTNHLADQLFSKIPTPSSLVATLTNTEGKFDTLSVSGTTSLAALAVAGNAEFAGHVSLAGITIFGSSATTDNFLVNASDNAIDPATSVNTISGGGNSTHPNLIGFPTKPRSTDFTPTDWADDIGYVGGSAIVATISGGYDNVNNQIAGSIVGGGHNFIKSNLNGHSIIGGGSYNLISASRSGIFSGRRNTITGNKIFSFIGSGDDNNITGSYTAIIGGLSNDINGDYSMSFGRRVKIAATGAVAFSDSMDADFNVTQANVFAGRFSGGYQLTGGNVGIGTTTPNHKLHITADSTGTFADNSGQLAITGLDNANQLLQLGYKTDIGYAFIDSYVVGGSARALALNQRGGNVGIGLVSPSSKLDVLGANAATIFQLRGASSTIVKAGADASGDGYLYVQDSAGAPQIILDADSVSYFNNGNIGIGTSSPYARLSVVGSVAFSGLTTAVATGDALCAKANGEVVVNVGATSCLVSSALFKHDIEGLELNEAGRIIDKLRPVTFKYNDTGEERLGLIAEEVDAVEPRLVARDRGGSPRSVRYEELTAVLVSALQLQKEKLDSLAARFANGVMTVVDTLWADKIEVVNMHATRVDVVDDVTVGGDISVGGTMQAKALCIGNTCVTEAELRALLKAFNTSFTNDTPTSSSEETAGSDEPEQDVVEAMTTDPAQNSNENSIIISEEAAASDEPEQDVVEAMTTDPERPEARQEAVTTGG